MPPLSIETRKRGSAFRVYGLTGGIAAGKSTAARFFEKSGIPVVDADEIARDLRGPSGPAHPAILRRFGTADRARLREIVFRDPSAKRDLESILHPLIRAESLQRIQALKSPVVIYEAALLVETGRHRDFPGLIVIEADRAQRLRRLVARDGCTDAQAEAILGAQASDQAKRAEADFLIDNSGSLAALRGSVEALAARLLLRTDDPSASDH